MLMIALLLSMSYMQTDAITPKIVGSTIFRVVASVLAVVSKRMQQLPTKLGPARHRGKDTTHKALETMCNARALQSLESCTNGCNIVALRPGDHATNKMMGVVGSKV